MAQSESSSVSNEPLAASTVYPSGLARRWRLRRHMLAATRHAVLILMVIVFAIPFFWMVLSALKDDSQIFARPIVWWPDPIHWENFPKALTHPGFPFLRLLGNSMVYAGSVTIGTALSCAAVGYGFARLRFPGRDFLFLVTLSTMMIPGIVTFIPTYILFKFLGLLGSYAPLIGPAFLGNAFYIFLLRQFFLRLPHELAEAGKLDGANDMLIFWRIMLPLVRPALMVVAVFTFLSTWHDFFGPLVYLSDPKWYPISLGLFAFKAQRTTEWSLLMAAATVATLPLLILFLFTHHYFLEGIKFTGLKG